MIPLIEEILITVELRKIHKEIDTQREGTGTLIRNSSLKFLVRISVPVPSELQLFLFDTHYGRTPVYGPVQKRFKLPCE